MIHVKYPSALSQERTKAEAPNTQDRTSAPKSDAKRNDPFASTSLRHNAPFFVVSKIIPIFAKQ